MTNVESAGVIGVGMMGSYFAEWLVEDGFETYVFDIDDERMAAAEEFGAVGTEHAADLASKAEIIVLSLPGSKYVELAMEGEHGVLETLGEDQVVVDTGTSLIETDVYYQHACQERGGDLVDAPLTWGGPGEYTEADGPAFTMFVGGTEAAYRRARPVLETLAAQHEHFGDVGSGQVTKAGHRLRQNNQAMVDAEMVEFLRNNGVDPESVDDLLELGIRDRMFDEDYPSTEGWKKALADEAPDTKSLEGNNFKMSDSISRPRMDVSHWAKDQAYAIEIGHSNNTALPVSSAVYHAMLMSENYAEALFDRELVFQDDDWFDRSDPISHFRRLNRPAEEWRRVNANVRDE